VEKRLIIHCGELSHEKAKRAMLEYLPLHKIVNEHPLKVIISIQLIKFVAVSGGTTVRCNARIFPVSLSFLQNSY
jgi:hypothetical protein